MCDAIGVADVGHIPVNYTNLLLLLLVAVVVVTVVIVVWCIIAVKFKQLLWEL